MMQSPAGTPSDTHSRKRRSSWRGMVVVLAMLLAGVVAAGITFTYWQGVIARTWPEEDTTDPTEAQPSFDEEKAFEELNILEHQYQNVAGKEPAGIAPSLAAADRFVEKYPQLGQGYTHRALIHADLEQYPAARADLEKSLSLNSEQPEAHALAGDLSFTLEDFDDAIDHLQKAVALAPEEPRFRVKLAQVHMERNAYDTARELLTEAIRLDSSVHEAHAAMSDLNMREDRLSEAFQSIERALEQTPLSDRRLYVLYIRRKATILRLDGKAEDALILLDTLFEEEQRDLDVLAEIARTWNQLGKPDRAAEAYEKAMVAKPLEWSYALEAARWRAVAGEPYVADRHLRVVKQLSPDAEGLAEVEALLSQGQSLE